jgi:hypothetical protein
MPQQTRSQRFAFWFHSNIIHLVMLAIGLALFTWMITLSRGPSSSDKASWLMIPLTGIYVVINVYMAIAGFRSAGAAQSAITVMQQTVEEMRRQTNTLYAPSISFPEGYKCWFKPDGSVEIQLSNLADQPAFSLQILLWEMEKSKTGDKICKMSTLRESVPRDFDAKEAKQTFKLLASNKTDIEKTKLAEEAEQRFQAVYRHPAEATLCVLVYQTKVSLGGIILVYDLEKIPR